MRYLAYILLFASTLLMSSAQPTSYQYRVSFAVKIGILPTGGLTQYALSYYRGDKLISYQPVERMQLEKIGTGEWPIPKTLEFYKYFENHGIYQDTLEDGTIIDFSSALDSLWKIRFEHHPLNHQIGPGWSQGGSRPSLGQQAYIYDRYGVRGYDQEYFSDSSFFQLLKDVLNPEWIAEYKAIN